jgi:hypothetical protein
MTVGVSAAIPRNNGRGIFISLDIYPGCNRLRGENVGNLLISQTIKLMENVLQSFLAASVET